MKGIHFGTFLFILLLTARSAIQPTGGPQSLVFLGVSFISFYLKLNSELNLFCFGILNTKSCAKKTRFGGPNDSDTGILACCWSVHACTASPSVTLTLSYLIYLVLSLCAWFKTQNTCPYLIWPVVMRDHLNVSDKAHKWMITGVC